ncbi:dihydroorotate dehydrogenase (quinone) [Arachidicoccus ginsenosidimutans]|uniref:quinone-dependent dihydroorotate dehydrogenase n=1 Tax=Arachidicoccus sp. BS20 TaxID=1850526 RepID=UPI0007F08290|nr:quinone-dependent dihydroorotate dehydrogenase [Arachidicoccus sp. BS20]ANI88530.1 dihydroorotate dehydrogenase (quinone) [Arachidicoccus sp. BS20]
MIYPLLRDILFTLSPEKAHYFSMNSLKKICNLPAGRNVVSKMFAYENPALEKEVFGLKFKNPVGLGAGFDKNALYLQEIKALGFGFTEIGTVTPRPQAGNELPRLFRLPKDKALVNRMGFNNNGVSVIKKQLESWRNDLTASANFIVGGNIGKNKITLNENAWKDYAICFNELHELVDYFTVNVSSPNTPGLRELQQKDSLMKIFSELENINQRRKIQKPILLKIAPDLTKEQLEDIVSISLEINLKGLILTNTTIERNELKTPLAEIEKIGAGGLSGKPLKEKSTDVLQYLSSRLDNKIPLIASGGIFTGEDAKEKISAGADLLQVWTGFIYEGPGIAGKICKSLL